MLTPKFVAELVKSNAAYLAQNEQLIDIFEGNLCKYVDQDLSQQFNPQTYKQAQYRLCPINILPKVIDKLTNIYQGSVIREADGTASDQELLGWYEEKMKPNQMLNASDELFNLSKASLIQPYAHNGVPYLRVILNDRFIVYSDDPICPNKPTHVILIYGKTHEKCIYHTYSADEFMISNDKEEIEYGMMAAMGNPGGVNPIGRLPFTYVNESKYRVQPKLDSDTLRIVKLLPVMLTDLNVAAMFQSFSIMYGIDLDDENIKLAPNAFLRFKSDPTREGRPEIGQIKPQVDYEQVLGLIQSELSMWLGSKGIRASSVGDLNVENFASGISKIIDEMDTYEARQKQVEYYQDAEADLWDLIFNYMHPYWVGQGEIENRALWSKDAKVTTTFSVQLPMQSRGQLVKDLKEEYAAGFTTRRRVLIQLNPDHSDKEIDVLEAEIDEERGMGIEEEETGEETEKPSEETTEVA